MWCYSNLAWENALVQVVVVSGVLEFLRAGWSGEVSLRSLCGGSSGVLEYVRGVSRGRFHFERWESPQVNVWSIEILFFGSTAGLFQLVLSGSSRD